MATLVTVTLTKHFQPFGIPELRHHSGRDNISQASASVNFADNRSSLSGVCDAIHPAPEQTPENGLTHVSGRTRLSRPTSTPPTSGGPIERTVREC
jgi:hypothetical protein